MNSRAATTRSADANRRFLSSSGRPAFFCDWTDAVFMHFTVPASILRPVVPFALDLHDGCAYISLVAFKMAGFRPRVGGNLARWVTRPLAAYAFLNLRTYVVEDNERGIYFLTEWVSNRLSAMLGPRVYGLPYRAAKLTYEHNHQADSLHGCVQDHSGRLSYQAVAPHRPFNPVPRDSLDEFLLERYTAYTCLNGRRRMFRIWHAPWPQASITVALGDTSLLSAAVSWFGDTQYTGAHYSPGVRQVWISSPRKTRQV